MKSLFIFVFAAMLSACASTTQTYSLSSEVYRQSVPFIAHQGEGRYKNYLAMNIHFEPVKTLFDDLNANLAGVLQNRGEAHITVITPPEYDKVLGNKVSIGEIEQIAFDNEIQSAPFTVVCIGRGVAPVKQGEGQTYFVVVESPHLLDIRRQVGDLFIQRGGDKNAFKPEHFFPHITLGFNPRDLHESDGIIKDKSSCHAALELN